MPSLTMIKKKVKELNEMWNIRPTPNGTFGVQQSLKERLVLRMDHLLAHAPEDAPFRYILNVMSRSSMFILAFIMPVCICRTSQSIRVKRVTPYIHAMHSHVGQFIRRHGALLPFTQQGLEKYNDRMTRMYFR